MERARGSSSGKGTVTAATALLLLSGCHAPSAQGTQDSTVVTDMNTAMAPALATPDPEAVARAQAEQERTVRIESIQRVLRDDSSIGHTADAAAQAQAMRAINLDGVPDDFRVAYVTHIQAWEDCAAIDRALRQLSSQEASDQALGRSLLATILGTSDTPLADLQGAIDQARARRREASDQVEATFQVVERTAASYGANLPAPSVTGNTM